MLADLNNNYYALFLIAKSELPFMGYLLLVMWGVNIFNWLLGSPLNLLGIYPRSLFGLIGIIFAPMLHGNFNHLFFNSIPFFVLGMFILMLGKNLFIGVTLIIAVLQGSLVWLFGRKYLHIGASGVISGYFGFVLGLAYFNPTLISLVLAFVTLYYFGSIIFGIIPTSKLISWESHLAGLIAGVVVAYVLWFYPFYESLILKLF
jgi:membrane associated rhomboid family serine protease